MSAEDDDKLLDQLLSEEGVPAQSPPAAEKQAPVATPPSRPSPAGGTPAPRPRKLPAQEQRAHPRYQVMWRAAVVMGTAENRKVYYGRTADISLGGTCVMMTQNMPVNSTVMLLLALPCTDRAEEQQIIEVRSRITNVVLASNVQKFRIGFQFREFHGDGRRRLERYLSERFSSLP